MQISNEHSPVTKSLWNKGEKNREILRVLVDTILLERENNFSEKKISFSSYYVDFRVKFWVKVSS